MTELKKEVVVVDVPFSFKKFLSTISGEHYNTRFIADTDGSAIMCLENSEYQFQIRTKENNL